MSRVRIVNTLKMENHNRRNINKRLQIPVIGIHIQKNLKYNNNNTKQKKCHKFLTASLRRNTIDSEQRCSCIVLCHRWRHIIAWVTFTAQLPLKGSGGLELYRSIHFATFALCRAFFGSDSGMSGGADVMIAWATCCRSTGASNLL